MEWTLSCCWLFGMFGMFGMFGGSGVRARSFAIVEADSIMMCREKLKTQFKEIRKKRQRPPLYWYWYW
jgi:hypothetical protein